jgi:hypothetical protein
MTVWRQRYPRHWGWKAEALRNAGRGYRRKRGEGDDKSQPSRLLGQLPLNPDVPAGVYEFMTYWHRRDVCGAPINVCSSRMNGPASQIHSTAVMTLHGRLPVALWLGDVEARAELGVGERRKIGDVNVHGIIPCC